MAIVPGTVYRAIRDPFPKLGTQSGFRKKLCEDSRGKPVRGEWAYVALQATGEVSDWPDKLDESTGIFSYYGDQSDFSKGIFDTKQKGNLLLRDVFSWLHAGQYNKIPPFFVFQNAPRGGNGVTFLGLAVPGNAGIPFGEDLQRAKDAQGNEVNNYLAYFTILDVSDSPITYEWLQARITDKKGSDSLAPKAWRDFIAHGLDGIQKAKTDEEIVAAIDAEIQAPAIDGETKKALINVRVNQSVFRNRLLRRYNKCCLCGVNSPVFLRASHIKPWADCAPLEKLDVDNGFLLCPNHDSLFDAGYISFSDEGSIIISEKLSAAERILMNVDPDMTIALTERNKEYLKYPNETAIVSSNLY